MYNPIIEYKFKNIENNIITDLSSNNNDGIISGDFEVLDNGIKFLSDNTSLSHDNICFNNLNESWTISIHLDYDEKPIDKEILNIFNGIYLSLLNRGVINVNKYFYIEFAEINYDYFNNIKIISIAYDGKGNFKIINNGIKLLLEVNDSEQTLDGLKLSNIIKFTNFKNCTLYSYIIYNEFLPDNIIINKHKKILNIDKILSDKFNYSPSSSIEDTNYNLNQELIDIVNNIKSIYKDEFIDSYILNELPKLDSKFTTIHSFTFNGKKYDKTKKNLYLISDCCLFRNSINEPQFRKTYSQLINCGVLLGNIITNSNGNFLNIDECDYIFTYNKRYLYVETDITISQWIISYNNNLYINNEPNYFYIKMNDSYMIFKDYFILKVIDKETYTMEISDNLSSYSFFYLNKSNNIFRYGEAKKNIKNNKIVFNFLNVKDNEDIYLIRYKYPKINNEIFKIFDNIPMRLPNFQYNNGYEGNLSIEEFDKKKKEIWLLNYIIKTNINLINDYQNNDIDITYSSMNVNKLKKISNNGEYIFIPKVINNKKSYMLGFKNGLLDTTVIKSKNKFKIDTNNLSTTDKYDILTFEYLNNKRISLYYDHSVGIDKKIMTNDFKILSRIIRTDIFDKSLEYPLFEIFPDRETEDKIYLPELYNGDEIILESKRSFKHLNFKTNINSLSTSFEMNTNLNDKYNTLLFIDGFLINHEDYDIINPSKNSLIEKSILNIYSFPNNENIEYNIDLYSTPIKFIPLVKYEKLGDDNLLYTRNSILSLPFNINKYLLFGNNKLISKEYVTTISSDIIHVDSKDTDILDVIGIDYDKDIKMSLLLESIECLWDITINNYSHKDIMEIFNLNYKPQINIIKNIFKLNKRLVDLSSLYKNFIKNMNGIYKVKDRIKIDGFQNSKSAHGEIYLDSNLKLYDIDLDEEV